MIALDALYSNIVEGLLDTWTSNQVRGDKTGQDLGIESNAIHVKPEFWPHTL